jgi:chemotaxis protein methyltransferase CheR
MTMTMTPATFDRIRNLVKERSAIVLDEGKEYLVEARLAPIAKSRGLGTLDELATRLDAAHGELVDEVVQAMTTNETSFFRDLHPFEALKAQVMPPLLVRRQATKTLRIWCGACSSGQEPYTIAILLKEHFPQLAGWDLKIFATDLSNAMLERAKAGSYRQLEVNRGLSSQQLLRFFDRSGLDWQLKPEIRSMVSFAPLNLVAPWPPTPTFDIVFLRNVLIYFDVDTKRRILAGIRGRLAKDGYLFLGGAETTMNIDPRFERAPFERASCYRVIDQ